MNENVFWKIISMLDWNKTGDDDRVVEPAIVALSKMDEEEIEHFENILAEKLHSLDTEAHARNIGEQSYHGAEEPFSVDWFLYERCCAVANGRKFFEMVLASPRNMPKDMEFEALLYIAGKAYERKTGKQFKHSAPTDYETFSNRHGWNA